MSKINYITSKKRGDYYNNKVVDSHYVQHIVKIAVITQRQTTTLTKSHNKLIVNFCKRNLIL